MYAVQVSGGEQGEDGRHPGRGQLREPADAHAQQQAEEVDDGDLRLALRSYVPDVVVAPRKRLISAEMQDGGHS